MTVDVLYLKSDEQDYNGKLLSSIDVANIVKKDTDAYDIDTNKLIFRFRVNVLPQHHLNSFYEGTKRHIKGVSRFRSIATGSKKGSQSNIFGFYDRFGPSHHRQQSTIKVRECAFNQKNPKNYKKTLPLINAINEQFKQLVPDAYQRQMTKAQSSCFRINDTCFTTVTTNLNFQTRVHIDKSDFEEGFGTLAVIEKHQYVGCETCFPQYNIAVDVRNCNLLMMDPHIQHGNLPLTLLDSRSQRVSIVCYLRTKIPENANGFTREQCVDQIKRERLPKESTAHTC